MQQNKNNFHRHFEAPGLNLYWIIIAYIIVGWFYPVVGLIALICMIGPVMTSIWKGRWWCGHVCPRGNMYDRLLSKYSPHKPIPAFVRTFGFRLFMVFFIFGMFGLQLTFTVPWSEGGLAMWVRWVLSPIGWLLRRHRCPRLLRTSTYRVPVR